MQNRHIMINRTALCLLLIMLLFGGLSTGIEPAIAQDENLLINPGFEGAYIQINGDPSLEVAPNWQPWFLPPPAGAPSSVNLRPDYRPAQANRVRSGSAAQEYNTFFATHDAGLYQRVPVPPGSELQFSVYVYVWSSATFEDPNESISPQDVDIQVGIDPSGGTDPESAAIVWSDPVEFYDEYRQLSITAEAEGNAVTVFIRTNPEGAIGVNNVYVDDASLIVVGTAEPTPTLETGNTPTPTQEGATVVSPTATTTTGATAVPSATIIPSATPIPDPVKEFPNRLTYTVQRNDTVSGIATRFNSTVEAIIAANGLDSAGFITVGQQLVIPVPAGLGQPAITATPTATATPLPTITPPAGGQPGTVVPTQQPSTQPTPGIHVVQPGENLFRIALRYNTTVEALATLNNISNPNLIFVGTRLRVPTGSVPVPPPPGSGGAASYVVQPGDNAFRIALRYGVTVEELARVNNVPNPNLIFVGQRLVIPR